MISTENHTKSVALSKGSLDIRGFGHLSNDKVSTASGALEEVPHAMRKIDGENVKCTPFWII